MARNSHKLAGWAPRWWGGFAGSLATFTIRLKVFMVHMTISTSIQQQKRKNRKKHRPACEAHAPHELLVPKHCRSHAHATMAHNHAVLMLMLIILRTKYSSSGCPSATYLYLYNHYSYSKLHVSSIFSYCIYSRACGSFVLS